MQESELILVVDDTPANLEVLSEALTDAGFEVAIATDGERAIKQAQCSLPSLILLDVMMPGIDGFETCRRLKASTITQDIPIIFMTALSETTDKVNGFNLGAVDYITKPFQEAELIVRVKTQLKVRHFHQTLEQQVSQRTAELTDALKQLQHSQLKLVQSEKMATLGQLVAGVAHEINNPVSFIHGNLEHMEGYTQTLLNFLQLYQKHYPEPVDEIQEQAEENDLEFLQEDVVKTLASMKVGTQRIREIVRSLRNFSRMDEVGFQAVNIHEGIDSTVMILQHRLKAKPEHPEIKVIREYGNLPLIECYAGQLNQAFMNILANAIDALEEINTHRTYKEIQDKPGRIIITTSVVDSQSVQIEITDNGPGIPEIIQQRIFDPFFTTKPIGKGTGMGMSITYQIITEKHNGKLKFFSTPGEGTTFVIQIPIRQQIQLR
ncbi:response regulator receiver sensor signal transduction histidine kinase [Nostoc sp. NIES-3756]|uniref:hybrid sensor histidine kinase/response regulator n=1 Tax=Nostoc sp. NIES-3756 TaxID=1751286 RepID=UPI000720AAEE|nr:response regulator [Nostoc sp. NIES-3756]BAT55988.1 response regulator receiver sensor signal transduction histidine kinase [Nostoc sp. NIES-3756]BAY36242.1 response regulator receiver sensor signal transduction histidine kinase [Nostoc sp. NIES-2111]